MTGPANSDRSGGRALRIFCALDVVCTGGRRSRVWRNNLLLPLVDLGHDVIEFDWDLIRTTHYLSKSDPACRTFIETNRPRLSEALVRQVERAHRRKPIDLLLTYFWDACVVPEAIRHIRSLGIVTVNWYCDATLYLREVEDISPHYDWCLVPEKACLPLYEAIGARPLYCQEAANPQVYRAWPLRQTYDISFVGGAYGDRPHYVQYLRDRGLRVHVFGPGWERHTEVTLATRAGGYLRRVRDVLWHLRSRSAARALAVRLGDRWRRRHHARAAAAPLAVGESPVRLPQELVGGILSDTAMVRTFSQSRINLGLSTAGFTHRTDTRQVYIRLRDFEVPMSGGFYMVEYQAELEDFFKVGREIVCYRDRDDLIDLAKYYLTHDTDRERIRQAGYARARRDHTWQKRFTEAFWRMGLL